MSVSSSSSKKIIIKKKTSKSGGNSIKDDIEKKLNSMYPSSNLWEEELDYDEVETPPLEEEF